MKKRIIMLAALLAVVLFCAGCGAGSMPYTNEFTGNLPNGYIDANVAKTRGTPFEGYTKALNLSDEYSYISTSYASNGYITVGNDIEGSTKYGVYSLVNRKLVVILEYTDISYKSITYYGGVMSSIQMFATVQGAYGYGIYNLTEEKWVIEYGEHYVDISMSTIGGVQTETRTVTPSNGAPSSKSYEINVDSNGNVQRTLKDSADSEYINSVGSVSINYLPALNGYSYNITTNKITGYRDGKQLFEVFLGSSSVTASFSANKYTYYQYSMPLPIDAKDYSFSQQMLKYKLTTCRLDMTNGNIKEYDNFKYLLDSGSYAYDKNNNPNYIKASAYHINGDKLLDESSYMLFNDDLGEVANLTKLNASGTLRKLGDNIYLNDSAVIDNKGKVLVDLSGYHNITFCAVQNLISLCDSSGNYGLIKTDGKIVAPFKYSASFEFYNNKAYNYNSSTGEYQFIDKDGNTTVATQDYYSSGTRIAYEYINGNYTYTVTNYSGDILVGWVGNDYGNYSFKAENSSYVSGKLLITSQLVNLSYKSIYYILY